MSAYYNENNPEAVVWLRELIKQGLIAEGEVDDRDIRDVSAADLRGFRQHHFFAGVGIWSYALRLAGWPDDREVWTGSCPCQPFSAAGKRKGAADERHLWPAWQWLIRQYRPRVIFGEQVASKDGIAWLDAVSTDLEGEGYAVGPVVLPACGVGAPHIRQRLWLVAHTNGGNAGAEREQRSGEQRSGEQRLFAKDGGAVGMGYAGRDGNRKHARKLFGDEAEHEVWPTDGDHASIDSGAARSLANGESRGLRERRGQVGLREVRHSDGRIDSPRKLEFAESKRSGAGLRCCEPAGSWRTIPPDADAVPGPLGAGPVNGYWRASDWLFCRDERWRPVEPGTFPLAHGAPVRLGRLRGYGNGITAPAAAEMIGACMEII